MKILAFDTESTTFQKGNPFARRNKCCALSYFTGSETGCIKIEYDGPVSRATLDFVQKLFDEAELIIGFNLKYDLHVVRRLGINFRGKRVWCAQVTQFVIEHQQNAYPSLNTTAAYWDVGQKIDIVEKEYWDKGIDTPAIPWDVLSTYANEDTALTYRVYEKQKEYLRNNPTLERLVNLCNQDLVVLEEMEWNGLRYDMEESARRSAAIQMELAEIDKELVGIIGNHPLNFNSGDHISAILYGGIIRFKIATPYDHTYKSGQKAGLTETRYKHSINEVVFPRLVEPLPKSELAKKGYFSTDAKTLVQLRAKGPGRTIIKLLQRRSALEQLDSMYYLGWPKRIETMDWEPGHVYSQLNQVVVITGRLSSNGPNSQNIPDGPNQLVKTRYPE